MTPSDLTWAVTRDVCALGIGLALSAAWLAGAPGALGAATGVGVAVGNFRWLASRARGADGAPAAVRALWSVVTGLRLVAVGGFCASMLATGWAHPVALVAGLTVLPCAVVVHGLRLAGQER